MTMYKHQSTGATAVLIEDKGFTISLKVAETNEIKEVGAATFKRWWKLIKDNETGSTSEESTVAQNETETLEVEETTPEETETGMDDQRDPGDKIDEIQQKPLALSEIVAKLENLFDTLNGLYFEGTLPRPIITIQSTPRAYGHCSSRKIWTSGVEGEGESYYEINIGAEHLNRPSENTAATMLHEMIHLNCRENGIKETCQGVRYHTKVFKVEAERRDLKIEYLRSVGYSITSPTEALIEKLREAGFEMEIPFARHTLGDGAPKTQRNKAVKYECPKCGQKVRSTADLNIKCGICEVKMERVA